MLLQPDICCWNLYVFLQAAQQQIQDLAQAADAGQCQIPGKVDDLSDCTYKSVHSLNHRHVNPVVRELVKTAFFRYFKASVRSIVLKQAGLRSRNC